MRLIVLLITILIIVSIASAQGRLAEAQSISGDNLADCLSMTRDDIVKAKGLLRGISPTNRWILCETNDVVAHEQCRLLCGYYMLYSNSVPIEAKLMVGTAFGMLGTYHGDLNMLSNTVDILKEYTMVYTNDLSGWRNLGSGYMLLGKMDDAMKSYDKAARLGDDESYVQYAVIAFANGRMDLVKEAVPKLQALEISKDTDQTTKEKIFTLLLTYSCTPDASDGKKIFVQAVRGLDMRHIVSMDSGKYRNEFLRRCHHFKGPEIDQILKIYEGVIAAEDGVKSGVSVPVSSPGTNNSSTKKGD